MESPRITLARVLELGVRINWREAAAIVHEAIAKSGAAECAGSVRVTADSCLLTRGGDVVLTGTAAQASPEAMVRLLDDLLASCSNPGRFAGAVADGTALDMIEELSRHTTPKRRRVEVASVALRGLAVAADVACAIADADEQAPSADVDDLVAAPTPAASPTASPRPRVTAPAPLSSVPLGHDQTFALRKDSAFGNAEIRGPDLDREDLVAAVEAARERTAPENAVAALAIGASAAQGSPPSATLRPAWCSKDLSSATPQLNAVRTAKDVRGGYPSRFDRVKRVSPAVLVCSVLAVAASGILVLQVPATRRSTVEPSEPAIEPPEIDAPVGLDRHTPLTRPDPDLLPEVADPPPVPPVVARSVPRGSPRIEDRIAPFTLAQDSFDRSIPPPTGGPAAPAENTATVAGSGPLSTTFAAAVLAPEIANSAGAPSPAVDLSSVVASRGAAASSPAETLGPSTDVPANDVARPPDREAEARAIETVLGRYRIAFNNLDASEARAVWPTVNEKTLAKAFERLESHDVSFESCQIEIFSVVAEAACSGSARYVPKVGSRTLKHEARHWRFSLRKASGGWLIDSVEAR